MDIDSLTIKEVKHLQSLLRGSGDQSSPYRIGKAYFIRTVTHHYTGIVEKVTAKEIVLSQAAWIADDGRFAQALGEGTLNEVEPFPQDEEVIIGRGAILDACIWKHKLPKEQK